MVLNIITKISIIYDHIVGARRYLAESESAATCLATILIFTWIFNFHIMFSDCSNSLFYHLYFDILYFRFVEWYDHNYNNSYSEYYAWRVPYEKRFFLTCINYFQFANTLFRLRFHSPSDT